MSCREVQGKVCAQALTHNDGGVETYDAKRWLKPFRLEYVVPNRRSATTKSADSIPFDSYDLKQCIMSIKQTTDTEIYPTFTNVSPSAGRAERISGSKIRSTAGSCRFERLSACVGQVCGQIMHRPLTHK